MLEANFWQDKSKSQKIIKEKKLYEDLINSYETSVQQFNDLDDLYKLAIDENNSEIQEEVNLKIKDSINVNNDILFKWYNIDTKLR